MPSEQPLFGWFERARQHNPPRLALVTADSSLDYSTLYHQTQALAACLLRAGLTPGEPLAAVCMHKQSLTRTALLAIYLGCPLLPLKPGSTAIEPLLEACGITQAVSDIASAYARCHCFSLHPDDTGRIPADCPPTPLSGNRTQLLIATSGSTGCARITRHSGDSLHASVVTSQAYTGLTDRDLWLNCLPMHHIGGFAILLRCLHAGAAMLIEEDFDATHIFAQLQQQAVTHLSLVPAMLAKLLDAQAGASLPAALRCVLVGGGPLSAALAHRALAQGWPISITWGMSETASHVALCRVQADWTPGLVGKPVAGCTLAIVDDQGQPVSGPGRIRIAGPMLMQGYCCTNADTGMDDGRFTSTDIGYLDAQGYLHLSGRADTRLNSGGYKIDPEAVESLLQQCPGIEQVALTAIEDDTWGDLLLALFTGSATQQAVARWCRIHLDSRSRPRRIFRVDGLPVTSLGKPDRPALARLAARLTASG